MLYFSKCSSEFYFLQKIYVYVYCNYCSTKKIVKITWKRQSMEDCWGLAVSWRQCGDSKGRLEMKNQKFICHHFAILLWCRSYFICKMRITGCLLGGPVRMRSRRQIAIVQEVPACQMSGEECMNILSCFKVKCGSLTHGHVHLTWEMECIVHTHIHTHTELMTVIDR